MMNFYMGMTTWSWFKCIYELRTSEHYGAYQEHQNGVRERKGWGRGEIKLRTCRAQESLKHSPCLFPTTRHGTETNPATVNTFPQQLL